MSQSHGIFLGLKAYAGDHNGEFPDGDSANACFAQLLPRYMEKEDGFFISKSAWHESAPNKSPDNDIGSAPHYSKALGRGENAFAYVRGLEDGGPSTLPIIADGFSDTPGVYSADKTKRGGVWHGEVAIVVYLDGQKKIELIDDRSLRVLKGPHRVDIFSQANGVDPANVLNPLK